MSRIICIATTPDVTAPATSNRSSSSFIPTPQRSDSANILNTNVCGTSAFYCETIARNKGLLLVAASQFFFSIMNLAVKELNSIDPPVPALEVSLTLLCLIANS